ncbi:MAG: hypothetical protein GY953_44060, partial [bacterium]|nr:hypothetical protein [bacterium]
ILSLRNWNPHPSEEITGTTGWKLATRQGLNYRRRAYQKEDPAGTVPYLYLPGVVVDVRATAATRLEFRTLKGTFSVFPAEVHAGRPRQYLGGAVEVDRVATAEQISSAEFENDFATILGGDEVWTAWTAYRNNSVVIMARRLEGGAWQPAIEVSEPGDIYRVELGRDKRGRVWVVWSEQKGGNFDLYGRAFDGKSWTSVERLTESPQSDVEHRITTDSEGRMWVVWQGFRDGKADIFAKRFDGQSWSAAERVSTSPANDWSPAITADSTGAVYVAWDTYDKGNYDVLVRRFSGGRWGEVTPIASTPRFEAHVRIACDAEDRLWAAWNESGFEWGKDTGFLVLKEGTRLYAWRSVRVGVFANGQRMDPVQRFGDLLPVELRGYNDLPVWHRDSQDRMWLFFRHRVLRSRDTPSFTAAHRAVWQIFGTVYSGNKWLDPVHVPFSRSRQDVRWGVANDGAGNIWAAWPTDFRNADDYLFQKAEVMAGMLPPVDGMREPPQLAPHVELEVQTYPIH